GEVCSGRVVEDDLGYRGLDDRATVRVAGDGQPGKGSIVPRRNEAFVFPTGPDHRVTQTHEQSGARVGRGRRIVPARAVENIQILVAAVDDFVEHPAASLRHVDGFDNMDIGRIFDHAVRVAWRQVDVRN